MSPAAFWTPTPECLNNSRVSSSYPLQGPATWCLIDGRTS